MRCFFQRGERERLVIVFEKIRGRAVMLIEFFVKVGECFEIEVVGASKDSCCNLEWNLVSP